MTVAVVTPVLNGAAFIETAVQSVLAQADVEYEYVVVDGGSTDGTLALLAPFEPRIRVVSYVGGQAAAINHGASLANGEILAILNADDWYLPGALSRAVATFAERPDASVVFGSAAVADVGGRILRRETARPFDLPALLAGSPIVQPASFIRRTAFESVGCMTASNRFTCDYDLWLRLAEGHRFVAIPEELAVTREREDNKSSKNRVATLLEAIGALRSIHGYVPYSWTFALTKAWLTGDDRRLSRLPTALLALATLAVGIVLNRRSPRRYVRDWWSYRAFGGSRAVAG